FGSLCASTCETVRPWRANPAFDRRAPSSDETSARHEPAAAVFKATLLNVLLALEPSRLIPVMHTTMIRASMMAYSTAVGPLSSMTNLLTESIHCCMFRPLSKFQATRSLVAGPTPSATGCVDEGLRREEGRTQKVGNEACPEPRRSHPFDNLATRVASWGGAHRAHGFASPPCGGFAISRMKR